MLTLVLGRRRTGKTSYCLEAAREAAQNGKEVILLVPEQFSFECQRLLLEKLGPSLSNKITIHSFTSLCTAINSVYGGLSGERVDDGTRFLLTRLAVTASADSLKHYARYINSLEFVKKAVSSITEMKQSAVSCEDLRVLAGGVDNNSFSDKLNDVATVFGAYNSLIESRFSDPLDLIEKTVNSMAGSEYFNNKTVIIDEFKGFTAAQYLMLDRIIGGSERVIASFCCDSPIPVSDIDIFANVSGTASRLAACAKSHGVRIGAPVILEPSPDMHRFESFMSGRKEENSGKKVEKVTVVQAASAHDEIGFVMNEIKRLVRENGYRYRDIVIISRSADLYLDTVENIASCYGVPCFTDTRVPAITLPLSVFVTAALDAVGLDTDAVMRYLKTGLSSLFDKEIATLENYVYVWNISGKKWVSDWNMNPKGLKKDAPEYDNTALNELRKKAIDPIIRLSRLKTGTAEQFSLAVMKLIDECDTISKIKEYTAKLDEKGMMREAEYQRAGYDVFIKAIDKICAVSKDVMTVSEYADMLKNILSFETVGEIPQAKDEVLYGTADRIRPMRPKVAFLLGVNEGVFPAPLASDSLFSAAERGIMIDNGLNVADNSLSDRIDENFLFYYSATAASEMVYLSFADTGSDGSALEPSSELLRIKKEYGDHEEILMGYGGFDLLLPESKQRAFEKMAGNFSSDNPAAIALKEIFADDPYYAPLLRSVESAAKGVAPSLSKEAARRLYGDDIELSASKIEFFSKCPFAYFCRYGMGANRLEKVDFDPLTRGNIVHYALEKFISAHFDDIGTLDPNRIPEEISKIFKEYLDSTGNSGDVLDERFKYLLLAIEKTIVYVCTALNNEFAVSEFRPRFCELKIGKGETVEPVTVKGDNGCNVKIRGSVDRVDTSPSGRVRVIDYKTGGKEFDLSDILDGMSMQMLIYLDTLIKNGRELLKADRPAGVLYMKAAKVYGENKSKFIKMDGLLEDDLDNIRDMDANTSGKIIPARIKNDGSFYDKSKVISDDDFKTVFGFVDMMLAKIGSRITSGDISAVPLKKGNKKACDHCDYASVCRMDDENIFNEHEKISMGDSVTRMRESLERR